MTTFIKDLADCFEAIWRARSNVAATVHPNYFHGILLSSGGYHVFRECSIRIDVSGQELRDNDIRLGSRAFMSRYIEPVAARLGEEIERASKTIEGVPTLMVRRIAARPQHSAPYHWCDVVPINGIPVEIETSVAEGILSFRFSFVLAYLEGE